MGMKSLTEKERLWMCACPKNGIIAGDQEIRRHRSGHLLLFVDIINNIGPADIRGQAQPKAQEVFITSLPLRRIQTVADITAIPATNHHTERLVISGMVIFP